ncbi:hypothetical protein A3Q56_06468 [Intoshia linei]|uniref:Uncharacterized protein n=1 Tax=Intoshia linei TaxID=1819745 RepID=A0A177AUW0_9BILA|nr:hypothetical protein A3Q56_06468 [Intoshia linei]
MVFSDGKIQTRFDFSVVKMNTTKVSYMELPYYIKDDFENFVKQNHSDVYVSTGDIEYIESPAKFYFVLYTTENIVNTIVDQIYVKIISHAIENYYVNLERLSLDSIKNDTSIQSKPSMKNEKTDIVKLNQNESNKKNPIIKAKKVNKANDVELKRNENLKKTISNKKITIIDPLKTKTKTYTLITEPPKKIVIEKKINHINKIKNEYKFSSPFKTSTKTVSLKFQQTLPNNFNNNTVELKNRTNVQNVSTNNTEKFNLTHQNDFISQEPSIGVMVNQFGYYKIITIVLIFMVTLLMLFSGLFIAYAIRSRNLQINPATLKTDTVNDDDKEIEKV